MSNLQPASAEISEPLATKWERLCPSDELIAFAGVAAQYHQQQVALFLLPYKHGKVAQLFAISNRDPFSGANVISRGIVGDIGGVPVVASPLYKQHFRLADGVCVEDPDTALKCWPVRIINGWIEISSVE